MFYYFSIIPLYVIIHLFLIHISTAISSGDDKMLIAFVRNDQKMQISEYSKQKYENHFGIVYFMRMRKNWQCDKIADEFEEFERTECQKYRKYFGILYEYLSSEYVGIPTVKPKFAYKDEEIEIQGPIIYAINCLTKIFFRFYFNKGRRSNYYDPKLLNEHRLNVGVKFENKESKLPINEMILQLAIDTANEWQQTNEILDGIIRQNFDKNMKELFIKAEERAKEEEYEEEEYFDVNVVNKNENAFDDALKWTDDALFSEFVKGHAATDLQKFSKCFINKNAQFEEHLQKYETHFCVVYFIKNNWHQCEAFCEDYLNCQMYRKHLHILYEYLFRLYAEAKSPNDSIQLSPVRPIFVGAIGFALSLIDVISNLNFVAKYSCNKAYDFITLRPMELVNEVELNYDENNKKDLNESTNLTEIRMEFEQKMKKVCEGKSKALKETFWVVG